MRKILISGGAGFIGGFLSAALAGRGCEVHLIDNLSRGSRDGFLRDLLTGGRVTLFERDLCRDSLNDLGTNYDTILHLAAIVGVQNVAERPYATLRDNVAALTSMLHLASRQRRLGRFVFTSTSEVYAGSLEALPMPIPTPEDTLLALPPLDRPRSAYMLSKLYGEALVRQAGVPFTIVRPHNVYGPRMGMSHVIPQLLERAYKAPEGDDLEVWSMDHRRTFCFIDDSVEMILRAAAAPATLGSVLNVGNQAPEITMGELAAIILRTVGSSRHIRPGPDTAGSPVRRCPDMSRLAALTGHRETVTLEEGIKRTFDWYRRTVFDATLSGEDS